jgi:hypothetical protein
MVCYKKGKNRHFNVFIKKINDESLEAKIVF